MAERDYPWLALRFELLRSGELGVRWGTHEVTLWSRTPSTADPSDAGVPIPLPPDLAGVAVSLQVPSELQTFSDALRAVASPLTGPLAGRSARPSRST